MNAIICALFATYSLSSGNRLLLQTNPFVPDIANPFVENPLPGMAVPETQSPPQIPVIFQAHPLPGQYIPPNLSPATEQPIRTIPGQVVLPPQSQSQSVLELNCNEPWSAGRGHPDSCYQTTRAFTNPPGAFKINCGAEGACAQSNLNMDYTVNSMVEYMEGIWCKEAWSCYGTTISIKNMAIAHSVEVRMMSCGDVGACDNMLFQCIGCTVNDFKCENEENCMNCLIEECEIGATCQKKPCYGM